MLVVHAKIQMHGAVACNCRVECEISGRGNWWVRSMKTRPALKGYECECAWHARLLFSACQSVSELSRVPIDRELSTA